MAGIVAGIGSVATATGAVGQLVSSTASAGGAYLQGQAQARDAEAQGQASASAYNYNAQVAENNATYVQQAAAEDERVARIQSTKQIGSMRAKYAASGVEVDQGSPLDVLAESQSAAELDALKIRHQGALRATSFRNDATLDRFRAQQALSASARQSSSASILGTVRAVSNFTTGGGWGAASSLLDDGFGFGLSRTSGVPGAPG